VAEEAKNFLEIIGRQDLQNVKLIAINLSHYTLDTHSFIMQVEALKNGNEYPSFIHDMKLIDASSFLEKRDYFLIDDHLNPFGHRKVANAIIDAMK
jgi:hypothetical protein